MRRTPHGRRDHPPSARHATECEEGFYGVRLYYDRDGRYRVGVCIQRMDLWQPIDEFLSSGLREEIVALREAEYRKLTAGTAG